MPAFNSRIKNTYFKILEKQPIPTSQLDKYSLKPILKYSSK